MSNEIEPTHYPNFLARDVYWMMYHPSEIHQALKEAISKTNDMGTLSQSDDPGVTFGRLIECIQMYQLAVLYPNTTTKKITIGKMIREDWHVNNYVGRLYSTLSIFSDEVKEFEELKYSAQHKIQITKSYLNEVYTLTEILITIMETDFKKLERSNG